MFSFFGCLPKLPEHPSPRGQGCALRPETDLERLVESLTLAQHGGDHQGDEEQEAGTCQGDPDEDVTEEIQIFLHSSLCMKREDGMSTKCSWPVLQTVLVSAFSWGLQGGYVGKSFLLFPAEAKSSPSPHGSTPPPHIPGVPRHACAFYVMLSLS